METVDPRSRPPWGRFLVLLLSLGVIATILGAMVVISLSHARGGGGETRQWMARLALLCTALLGLTLVAVFWLVVRFLRSRMAQTPPSGRTRHVDAWRLAGQRLQVGPDDKQENDPGDGDGPR